MSNFKISKSAAEVQRRYKFTIEKSWLTMPDGVRLAATAYIPTAKRKGETFPVLLEYLPYRKDDTFYVVDHPFFSYQAQLGFITVKVDIRGTGGSFGNIPEREYSNTEMEDCEEIIRQLATRQGSNGNVGMFGVSWSGFNSIQMALRRPPALKAICAVHASDDLYNDDLHYIDGNLHLDPYHLYICHELGLPRTPDYKLDSEYFSQRFNHRPWLFTYLNNQVDGQFWRKKSLREDYSQIDIPVYLIGGLLDGYRSATARMFQELHGDVRCDIGPWEHSCPDEGQPGPNYEWQKELAVWFNKYLRPSPVSNSRFGPKSSSASQFAHSGSSASSSGPIPSSGSKIKTAASKREMLVYVRHGHPPDVNIESIPGYWRIDTLPARNTRSVVLQLTASGALHSASTPAAATSAGTLPALDWYGLKTLPYKSFAGTAAGTWWGNKTGDMRFDDEQSIIFDSAAVEKALQIIGTVAVRTTVCSTSGKAKWAVRLEDIAPDGSVTLVTGALCNPSFLANREATAGDKLDARLLPVLPKANEQYELNVDLQFTTWTFQKGHKIRLAIANAQFPMAWPSNEAMISTVVTSSESTLTLPVVPTDARPAGELPRPVRKQNSPNSWGIDYPAAEKKETKPGEAEPDFQTFNKVNKKTGVHSHTIKSRSAYVIDKLKADDVKRTFLVETNNTWSTNPANPADSSYLGIAETTIISQGKRQKLRTRISVCSDAQNFYITVNRTVSQNGRVRKRRFFETVARQFQ